jgi:metal-sulfur cluster biosynthetic enzyme
VTSLEHAVRVALDVVRDPELDEAITGLGFVAAIAVDGGAVRIRLRLPTYFCAPNFAWLMVADARRAVAAVPGVTAVDVHLEDHFASEQINGGVARDAGFQGAFPGLADAELSDLRRTFRRKAFQARQHRLITALRRSGTSRAALCALRLRDLEPGPETAVYLQRRAELGLAVDDDAPVVLTVDGDAVPAQELDAYLARIRAVDVSVEGNAGLCRGLLATRYPGTERPAEPPSPPDVSARQRSEAR